MPLDFNRGPLSGGFLRIRARLSIVPFWIAALALQLQAQQITAHNPPDVAIELRTATGSNRFHIGEVITLEVLLSSSTPNRYLEPCELFSKRNFGFPQCRFRSRWTFDITPLDGWVDYEKEFQGRGAGGGPSFEVPSHDLTSQPVKFSYVLTSRFRFDRPGEYHIRLSMPVGLDDETTRRPPAGSYSQALPNPNVVELTRDIDLVIVPADVPWEKEVIRKGLEAYSSPKPPDTAPPSPELLRYQEATLALCNLGTPDAGRALAALLSQGHDDVNQCLMRSPGMSAAIEEMQRLLVDPKIGIKGRFFRSLVWLLDRQENEKAKTYLHPVPQHIVDSEREMLFASLPQKQGEALITSLLTVLQNPPMSNGSPFESPYELLLPPAVIEATAANFERLPTESRTWLLTQGWDRIRSPLMVPLLRARAGVGDGPALLRWLELDPGGATPFARKELVRPVPRFSSFYLRLRHAVSKAEERQIATNFVALSEQYALARSASLLHLYATRAVLPTVLPFIDANLPKWPCSVKYPVLAYLLKVSPASAERRVSKTLEEAKDAFNADRCKYTFFIDLGTLQPSPVLERLAFQQFSTPGTSGSARDAADYLQRYGSKATKPLIWDRLKSLQKDYVSSGAERRVMDRAASFEDRTRTENLMALASAYVKAQAWVLSPAEETAVVDLMGTEWGRNVACTFRCGGGFGLGPNPAKFAIYGGPSAWTQTIPLEYLNAPERLQYSVDQYTCPDMKSLKEKLLELPTGSTFDFAGRFSARDRDELVEISNFLWSHGYKVHNGQQWPFLRPNVN